MKLNGNNNQNNIEPEDMMDDQFYQDDYMEEDDAERYYSPQEIEREQLYLQRQQLKNNFIKKVKNPFGINDKINNLDAQLQYGSSKTKLIFVLGSLAGLAILAIIFFAILK